MAWYRTGTYVPQYRRSISLDGSGSSADFSITIPPQDDLFWETVDASGNEIRVTDADGVTALTYQLSGFNRTNRTGSIEIDNFAAGSGVEQVFLYFGMSGASSGAGSFTASAARSGYIDLAIPSGRPVPWTAERPGATTPQEQATKGSGEQVWVTFDLGPVLAKAIAPYGGDGNKHQDWEEARLCTYAVYSGASSQPAMVDATKARFLAGGRFLRVLVKAGSTGTDYTLVATITTTFPNQQAGQTREKRVEVVVKNVAE